MTRQIYFVCLCFSFALFAGSGTAFAAQDSFAPLLLAMDNLAAKHEHAEASASLAKKFHPFILSQESAGALLNAVQYSQSIALLSPANGEIVRIVPATKPMSLANAYVALSFARQDLAQYGVSQPTPAQLKWALNGGQFRQINLSGRHNIHLKGVLKQRAQGKTWDAVAKSIGVNADTVRYDMEAAKFVLIKSAPTPSYSSIKAFPEDQGGGQASLRTEREKPNGAGLITAHGASTNVSK